MFFVSYRALNTQRGRERKGKRTERGRGREGQTDGWMEGQTDGWMEGQTDNERQWQTRIQRETENVRPGRQAEMASEWRIPLSSVYEASDC